MNEPLVLLPGMMCDARLFSPQIARFSTSRPVAIMPQIGHSSIAEIATDILAHAPPKFALAGLSMGGITAMEIVRQAPERVSRLALLDTNPLADSQERIDLREAQIGRVRASGLRGVMRDEMKPNYLSDGPNKSEILDLCMAMADVLGEAVFERQTRALQGRRDQCDTLRSVKVPTLILCGEDDLLCPIERHELMRELVPDSRLEVIKAAGHLPTLEQPELTNEALGQWMMQSHKTV